MIRTNLSTRPFYNERVVRLWLLLIAMIALAATLFNATRIMRYSRSDTELGLQASRDEARAIELRQQAVRLRGSVDAKQIEFASIEARQANSLIDRRTFSWTELLNRFESTLPDDVRITSVRPKVDKGEISIAVTITARNVEDVSRFLINMEANGAFIDPLAHEEHRDENGALEASIETGYVQGAPPPGGRGAQP